MKKRNMFCLSILLIWIFTVPITAHAAEMTEKILDSIPAGTYNEDTGLYDYVWSQTSDASDPTNPNSWAGYYLTYISEPFDPSDVKQYRYEIGSSVYSSGYEAGAGGWMDIIDYHTREKLMTRVYHNNGQWADLPDIDAEAHPLVCLSPGTGHSWQKGYFHGENWVSKMAIRGYFAPKLIDATSDLPSEIEYSRGDTLTLTVSASNVKASGGYKWYKNGTLYQTTNTGTLNLGIQNDMSLNGSTFKCVLESDSGLTLDTTSCTLKAKKESFTPKYSGNLTTVDSNSLRIKKSSYFRILNHNI